MESSAMKGAEHEPPSFQHKLPFLISVMMNGNRRYKHQLSPDIVKGPWTKEEDLAILASQSRIGNKWAEM
jgi:hypothetical protein